MKANIIEAREDLSAVVRQAVEEAFNTMLQQPVLAGKRAPSQDFSEVVFVNVKLNHGPTTIDFSFKFDMQLLIQAAQQVFSAEYIKNNAIHEDIGCEIVNIVCHKVKAYLNEEGYFTEMGFPYVPEPGERLPVKGDFVQMHFFYRGKDAQPRIGVAVDSCVV
ncbi:MAG: hypothetical protein EPN97_03395 [Alphaproteobacteria bacterium]|nr:MAG: hypothetical protein EPN97_03395 [Alphaproteobacteria bacterium]